MVMRLLRCLLISFIMVIVITTLPLYSQTKKILDDDPAKPSSFVRLVFIHHSTGGNWLADVKGGLAKVLFQNNYYVSDVCYGWGRNGIGDRTDIGNWWEWFRDPEYSSAYLHDIYTVDQVDEQFGGYERNICNPDPLGENKIIMFKSCFPNSALGRNPNDTVPSIENNPMKSEGAGSESYTVANAKGIYIDLLEYFKKKPDKLFIVITAPPLSDPAYAENARAFNQWLVNDWLSSYPLSNVFVFDFYNCLTTNGGTMESNDLGAEGGNHHRWWNGAAQHTFDGSSNTLAYPSDNGNDDHPNPAGNEKTTSEYVPLLNVAYNRWQESITEFDEYNILADSPIISITPSPVNENLIINYELPSESPVKIEVFNSLGICIDKITFDVIDKSGTYNYNAANLSNGEYYLKFYSQFGFRIVPLIVIK